MEKKREINPDDIIHAASQAKLEMYEARETYEAIAKQSNDYLNELIALVTVMKKRIIALESEVGALKNASDK